MGIDCAFFVSEGESREGRDGAGEEEGLLGERLGTLRRRRLSRPVRLAFAERVVAELFTSPHCREPPLPCWLLDATLPAIAAPCVRRTSRGSPPGRLLRRRRDRCNDVDDGGDVSDSPHACRLATVCVAVEEWARTIILDCCAAGSRCEGKKRKNSLSRLRLAASHQALMV